MNWQLLALLQSSIVCCFLCNPYRQLTPSSPAYLVRNNLQLLTTASDRGGPDQKHHDTSSLRSNYNTWNSCLQKWGQIPVFPSIINTRLYKLKCHLWSFYLWFYTSKYCWEKSYIFKNVQSHILLAICITASCCANSHSFLCRKSKG